MALNRKKEAHEPDDTAAGLNILSLAVLERSALSEEETKPQWRGIKGNDINQKNGKQTISHRHIEKRRRDRINNTLWMLKDIVPAAKLKYASGSGRLEKADLLEMTVQHLKHVHRSLAKVAEKQDSDLQVKSSAALSEIYCNGFKDGIVHILNELKKLNLLTPTQTERLLKEELKQNDAMTFQKEFNFSESNVQFLNQAEELAEGHLNGTAEKENNKVGNNERKAAPNESTVTETCDLPIKTEEPNSNNTPLESHFDKVKEDTMPSVENETSENTSIPWIPGSEQFFKRVSLPAGNGYNCPLLIPAYALHASGTHYVPVLLPPSSVLPSNLK